MLRIYSQIHTQLFELLYSTSFYEVDLTLSNVFDRIGRIPVKPINTDYKVVPSTIFTSPNISSVGLRRKSAKNSGFDVLMGLFSYKSLGKAKCMGKIEEEGFLITLADKETLKIIGASCIGVEAPELISEISLAIKNDLTIHNVAETIHCHPTISEMVNEGCEAVIGKAIHKKGRPLHL